MFRVHDPLGEPFAASFDTEASGGTLSVVFHSAGGASRGGGLGRNSDYPVALETLLRRLGAIGAALADAYVDSKPVQGLPVDARRLDLGRPYPLNLSAVPDFDELRRAVTRAQKSIGSSASRGGSWSPSYLSDSAGYILHATVSGLCPEHMSTTGTQS